MENGKTSYEAEEISVFGHGADSPFEKIVLRPTQEDGERNKTDEVSRTFETRRKNISAALSVSAAILITASLAVHTVLLVGALRACKSGGSDFLLSTVFPKIHTEKKENSKGKTAENMGADGENGENSGQKEVEEALHGESPYINCDLSSKSEMGLALMNETSYEPDLAALLGRKKPIPSGEALIAEYGEGSPLVLIYHTHGTEAYSECADEGFRTRDVTKNVVAVGETIAEELKKNGVEALHLTEMFDDGEFSTAYDRSTQAVRQILARYPSVRYVLDIHRDFVDRDGDYVRCASVTDDKSYAQLMFVCGTDEGGSGHINWQDNLTVSLQMQSMLWQKDKNLMRPVDLKSASFYQDTGAGSLIVEFGCCGNTLAEAKASAAVFAQTLTEYIFK